ncbi:protein rogdi-like isoform X1 [Tubulanus polymorphus]|uniref:protein rogdi-like isoform X1 n=1 Tax=Tubulanus polymorphus TaxID=672921 RepID=UPI003DA38231
MASQRRKNIPKEILEQAEKESMYQEFKWLIEEEVENVIRQLKKIVNDCCRRFAVQNPDNPGEENIVKPEKFLLSSSNDVPVKCMVTLMGDVICEANISINTHKHGNLPIRSAIQPGEPWRLQQIQDAGNYLCKAIHEIYGKEDTYTFQGGQELLIFFDRIIHLLMEGKQCLLLPKKKTLTDLIHNRNMKSLSPAVPNNTVLSFYIQAQKLILAIYHLTPNQNQHYEIGSRHQVECTVPWLHDTILLFTIALEICQQFRDKVHLFMNDIDDPSLKSRSISPLLLDSTDSETRDSPGPLV